MIENEILFVTTTLYTKWLSYQKNIIKKLFPNSDHLIIDGTKNWPYVWFTWIDQAKLSKKKYYIHIDEDCFITNKDEVIKCIQKMELEGIDLLGCSDGYQRYRQHNPVAMNPFFMIGKVEHLKDLNFSDLRFTSRNGLLLNNYNLYYKEEYLKDFKYNHKIMADFKFDNFEPFYVFFWKMKEMGLKLDYLYPHFDERFKSTNPRVDESSEDIAIHMWYSRVWNHKDQIDRYNLVEKYLNK